MSRTFSESDHILRMCKRNEIGAPWEDRWSVNDYLANECSESQVGLSKGAPPPADPLEPQPSLSDDERVKAACAEYGIDIGDIPAVTRLMFSLWPYSFSKTHGALVRGEGDRIEAERLSRLSASARLADLTATKLKAMDDRAIWMKVIMGVQQNVEPEQFERILTAWGIDPAQLLEMVESGELTDD